MEEQRSAGGAERQVTKLVEDDKIGVGEPRRDLAGFALKLLLFESVDEFDGGEEADALAVVLDRLDPDRGRDASCRAEGRRPGRRCGRLPGTRSDGVDARSASLTALLARVEPARSR